MKNRYERLSKEEKKEARDRFKNTEDNKLLYKRLFRLQIICIIGILFGIGVMAYCIITHDKWYFIAEYGFMTVFCVTLIMFCKSTLDKTLITSLLSYPRLTKSCCNLAFNIILELL